MSYTSLPIARAGRSTPRAALVALAALVLAAAPARQAAAAQSDSVRVASRAPLAPLSRTDDARMSAPVREQVENHRARAHTAREAGNFAEAREAFLAAAALMRQAGVLPVRELRGAAAAALAEGQPLVSAAMLDTLATDASAFGVPLEQAQALADAAEQYGHAGDLDVARARLSELRMLLVSPPYPPAGYRSGVVSSVVAAR